tara:strand:+ start:2332 stop:3171 length:840 start_codon:yes stop_codon:yes gene_type:complete
MGGYIGSSVGNVANAAERKQTYSITTATTSLTGLAYTPTKVHVFHNGVRLVDGTDYTATNGTSITLTNAAQNGDEVVVISYPSFQTSDTVSAANGGTFAGNIAMSGTLGVTGATTLSSTLGVTGKITSTAGITFGSDTAAVNVLDDYEEGIHEATFAMNGSGSVTMTRSHVAYTKVGRMVTITAETLVGSISSPVGSMTMSLPFAIGNNAGGTHREMFIGARPVSYHVPLVNSEHPVILGNSSAASITFVYEGNDAAFANYTPAVNETFNMSFSYFTDA